MDFEKTNSSLTGGKGGITMINSGWFILFEYRTVHGSALCFNRWVEGSEALDSVTEEEAKKEAEAKWLKIIEEWTLVLLDKSKIPPRNPRLAFIQPLFKE
jgi:hypothetical protein